ncbi:Uncharacterised protein [Mycobacteroides abscessus subsp. abscessus]|nr:Uncharacterised protein [Mycobacteroides abscessus subsp. abscessus]
MSDVVGDHRACRCPQVAPVIHECGVDLCRLEHAGEDRCVLAIGGPVHRHDVPDHLVGRAITGGHRVPARIGVIAELIDHGAQQLGLVGEVVVENSDGFPGLGGDVDDPRLGVPDSGDDHARGVHQGTSGTAAALCRRLIGAGGWDRRIARHHHAAKATLNLNRDSVLVRSHVIH